MEQTVDPKGDVRERPDGVSRAMSRTPRVLVVEDEQDIANLIKHALERRWKRKWLEFRDIAGSRICVRTKDVVGLYESTEAQRAQDRRHSRYMKAEAPEDENPWEGCW